MTAQETLLKTSQVAEILGLSVSTVKRLVNAGELKATLTLGKHRLVTLSSVIEYARRENYPPETLRKLEGDSPLAPIDGSTADLLIEALRLGDARQALCLIESAYESGNGAAGLADEVIRPVMERIGHGWMLGTWDVYHEHQATQLVFSAVSELIGKITRRPASPTSPLAIGAASEGDIYLLPGLLSELVLREGGWDVRNLGANLPLKSLAAAVREYRPRLIFLTASHLVDRVRFFQEYAYLYEAASQVHSAIILGGRAFDHELKSRLVYASFGERMSHLAEFARSLLPPSDPARNGISDSSSTTTTSTRTEKGILDADQPSE